MIQDKISSGITSSVLRRKTLLKKSTIPSRTLLANFVVEGDVKLKRTPNFIVTVFKSKATFTQKQQKCLRTILGIKTAGMFNRAFKHHVLNNILAPKMDIVEPGKWALYTQTNANKMHGGHLPTSDLIHAILNDEFIFLAASRPRLAPVRSGKLTPIQE